MTGKRGKFETRKCAEECTDTINKTVASVLEGKHPREKNSTCSMLEMYEETPIFITVKIMEDAVKSVANKPFWIRRYGIICTIDVSSEILGE